MLLLLLVLVLLAHTGGQSVMKQCFTRSGKSSFTLSTSFLAAATAESVGDSSLISRTSFLLCFVASTST